MIEEKKVKIINELEGISEETLDDILFLIEESKKATYNGKKSIFNVLAESGIKPPLDRNKPRPEYVPIEVKGKPMSEMIIEDRR